MDWQVPPAASMRLAADFENAWAWTVSGLRQLAARQAP
jgi:hypothetical protein